MPRKLPSKEEETKVVPLEGTAHFNVSLPEAQEPEVENAAAFSERMLQQYLNEERKKAVDEAVSAVREERTSKEQAPWSRWRCCDLNGEPTPAEDPNDAHHATGGFYTHKVRLGEFPICPHCGSRRAAPVLD